MSKPRRQRPAPPEAPATLEQKVEEIHERLVRDRHSELYGLLEILGNRRRLMWLNFVAGLSRGVGFFLGVSLVGALLLGALGYAFNRAATTLGFKDLTLEQAVRAAVLKYEQVEQIVEKTQDEVHSIQEQGPQLPTPPR